MLLAGFIRRKPVPMVRCLTVDLEVPAEAEFVLEGYVDPEERAYRRAVRGPHRLLLPGGRVSGLPRDRHHPPPEPHLRATIVGRPPMEDCYLAKATERIFLPLLNADPAGDARLLAALGRRLSQHRGGLSIAKEYPGHARKRDERPVGTGADELLQGPRGGGLRT